MKRFFLLFSITALLCSSCGVAKRDGQVTILHTNDMHSQFVSMPATWIDADPKPQIGGMVALEMARYLEARACLLIGSIRSREELPKWVRAAKPLISATPSWLMGTAPGAALALRATAGRLAGPRVRSLLEQFGGTSGRFLRWALLAMLRWETLAKPLSIPVFHIHGDRDHVLPHRLTRPDVVVRGAGHLLMLTYPEAVNEFLENHRRRLSGAGS